MPLAEVRIHHLAVLTDHPVQVRPLSVESAACLIHHPLPPDRSLMAADRLPEQWQEAPNPAIDCADVGLHARLRQLLHDVGIAQSIAHVSAHGQ